jgi:hypothetical protein
MADSSITDPYIPNIDYERDITTYNFIRFVQTRINFLTDYVNYVTRADPEERRYLTNFLSKCYNISVLLGDDGTFDEYRGELHPFMEWITLWAEYMNTFYEQNYNQGPMPTRPVATRSMPTTPVANTPVSKKTRSNRKPINENFIITPFKRGTNMITLEPTKQEGARITLSDGKSYTYDEIIGMWQFSKIQTPLRHQYTEEDKQKIINFIDFVTKGGKTRGRTMTKTKSIRKNKTKPNRKNKKKSIRKNKTKSIRKTKKIY